MADLNGFGIFGGLVFVAVIFLVIYPISFRLPIPLSRILLRIAAKLRLIDEPAPLSPIQSEIELSNLSNGTHARPSFESKAKVKPIRVKIGLSSAPLLGVLLLLITTSIGGDQIAKGIAGEHGVRPYDVLILFISLAYIATALDATGALRYLAFHIALRAKNGNQLYFYLYTFFFFTGAIIGNDPIILSGTPFLAYLTRVSGIVPPTAWIFAQFLAANVSSAILVSSNPTNVLVAGAFELNFLAAFTKYTVLPSVVAGIVAFPILFFAFKSKPITSRIDKTSDGSNEFIPAVFEKPDVDPRSALVDPAGAIFHAVLLLITLAVLVGTSFIKTVEVWMITAPAGLLGFARDLISDWRAGHGTRIVPGTTDRVEENGTKSPTVEDGDLSALSPPRNTLPSLWRKAKTRLPNASITFSRLPWPLLPFAVGMFILVRSLQHFGYIDIFAGWAVKVCTSPAAAVFFVGSIVAFGLCPLAGTNIGATILAVEVLNSDTFQSAAHIQADPRILRGAIYAVAMASNTGALVTLPSSLAGLLWHRILSQKGIRISQKGYSLINLGPVCIMTFVSLAIVLVEVLYWE